MGVRALDLLLLYAVDKLMFMILDLFKECATLLFSLCIFFFSKD